MFFRARKTRQDLNAGVLTFSTTRHSGPALGLRIFISLDLYGGMSPQMSDLQVITGDVMSKLASALICDL
jgi:hypothetical protein